MHISAIAPGEQLAQHRSPMAEQFMSFEAIKWTLEGRVGTLRLNRPQKHNAVNERMIREIDAALDVDPIVVGAVAMVGEGANFSAGLDLSEHIERDAWGAMEISRLWHCITDRIQHRGVPVISALSGHVIGAGLEIAASTHIRIAEENCQFALPEGRRGIFVGGGASVRVARLIGESRLMEMMLTGRTIGAEEALRIGLVHHVVPVGTALLRAQETASIITENAPLSNLMMVTALPRIAAMPPAEGLFTEALAVALAQTSPDAKARMGEFLRRGSERTA